MAKQTVSLSSQITSEISTAISNGEDLTGLSVDVNANGKDHVKYNHTKFDVDIVVNQDGTATVTTTQTDGNGKNAETTSSTQTVHLSSETAIDNIQSITGIDVNVEAEDKSHVMFNHVDWNVDIFAFQNNTSTVSVEQSGGSDSSASIDVSNTQEIVGFALDVDVSDKAKVKFNHNDIDVEIVAVQENSTDASVTQTDDIWG